MTDVGLDALRRTLARRLQEKAELEAQVRTMQSRLWADVAPLQEEVLRVQKERLKAASQARRQSARLRNAYHDAEDAYEQFRAQISSSDVDDPEALKAAYRRATKRCHPDAVDDAYREEATATFRALESAYDAGEGAAVRSIADALEASGFPRSPAAPAEGPPDQEAEVLSRAVSRLDASIEKLRSSTAYEAFRNAGEADVDAIVGAWREKLRTRLQEVRRRQRARF